MSKNIQQTVSLSLHELETWAYGGNLANKPEEPTTPFIDLSAHFSTISEFGLISHDKFEGMYHAMSKMIDILDHQKDAANSVEIPLSVLQPMFDQYADFAMMAKDENPLGEMDRDFHEGLRRIQINHRVGLYAPVQG